MIEIPVTWLLPDGTPTKDTVVGEPCITIGYSPQPSRVGGRFDETKIIDITAMIDTGATYTVVDSTTCAASAVLRTVNAEAFLSGGTAQVRTGTLFFTGSDGMTTPCSDEFCSVPILGKVYKAVIGRGFLKICDLRYDGPNRTAVLTIRN